MSKKYVIEIYDGEQYICINGECEHKYYTRVVPVADLEELTAEYVNENYGQLQDDAYMRGVNDHAEGVTSCEFCKYEDLREGDEPCCYCSCSYVNKFVPKVKDDEIKVSDEIVWTEDESVVIVVTRVYTENDIEWCDGVCRNGTVYQILAKHARKTGRHFDIKAILEDMQE